MVVKIAGTPSADGVARLAVPDVVGELVDVLGTRLVAYIGGVSHTKFVRSWRNGSTPPRDRRESALRGALQAARILLGAESKVVAQAWFTGANTKLGLEAPAAVLRGATSPDEISRVVRAASAFIA
jgi:hypothetical protein